ncbi:MAG: hypothetical protein HY327_10695, partial [Chloroflexi bacterium]|nr:hypothetical protein [Chloroflexota bacterium]
ILQQLDAAMPLPNNGHATPDSGQPTADDDIERAVAQVRAARQPERRCGNCAQPFDAGDQFCARCGNKL